MTEWSRLAHLNPSAIKKLQEQRLSYLSRNLLPFHPFYRDREDGAYLRINTIDDLHKLPFTTKVDILPTPENPGKSRDFILQPNLELIKKHWPKTAVLSLAVKKIMGVNVTAELEKEFKPIHTHFTTGRSSAQIPFLYSSRDMATMLKAGKRIVETLGLPNDSVVINAFPFAPHLAFWLTTAATQAGRLLSVQTGGGKVLGTQKILDLIEKLKGTMLIVMPGYGYHVLREAVEQKRDLSTLKYIVLGGEKIAPGIRKKMKELLKEVGAKNVQILGTYAFTEGKVGWVQCHEDSGFHLYPDMEHVELVDEDGNPVKEGESGEVVYTSLDWRASTLVRYRTGDICAGMITNTPCEFCGRTTPRLLPKIERKFDTVGINLTKVKGELVNLATFAELIHDMPEISEWQIEITKKNNDPFEVDELFVHVALKKNVKEEAVLSTLAESIRNTMMVSPIVVAHPLKELVGMLGLETDLKEKRIVDLRKKVTK